MTSSGQGVTIFGLLEGDEVIISSMKNYLHLDEVPIR